MKTFLGIIAAALLTVGLCGCENNPSTNLPKGVTNVKEVGNNWWTFEMVIDGKTHRFLYRRYDRGETCCEISRE